MTKPIWCHWDNKTRLTQPLFIEVSVPSQECEQSCICVLGISVVSGSTIIRLDFGIVLKVPNFVFHIFCFKKLWILCSTANHCARLFKPNMGCRGRDRMVVGFATTCAISVYHHWCCEFESRSGRGVQHYVIKFVSDLRQIDGFLLVFRVPPPIKLTATILL